MSNTSKNRLREVRENLGLSGTNIADRLEVSPQYYYDLETGRRRSTALNNKRRLSTSIKDFSFIKINFN